MSAARQPPASPAEVPWLLAEETCAKQGAAVRAAAPVREEAAVREEAPVREEAAVREEAPVPGSAPVPTSASVRAAAPPAPPRDPASGAEPEDGASPPPPLRGNRDFTRLWGGAGLSLLAGRATTVAYPIVVLWATGSPSDAGLVGTALLLPQLLVQLPGGVLVDRYDRKRIMVLAGLGQALVGGLVAFLFFSGRPWLWALLGAAFVEGALGVLQQLAERAAVPAVVPRSQLPTALTGNEARTRGAAIAGQPLGSGLAAAGSALPFGTAAVLHLLAALSLSRVRGRLQQERTGPRAHVGAEIREGLVWMWHRPFLRAVMSAVAVTNVLFQGLNLAVMAAVLDHHGSQFQVGLILSLSGAGGLVGALSGGWWNTRVSLRALVLGGLLAWTALMLPVAAVLHQPFALGALFAASGYVGGVFNVAGGVLIVRSAPDRMRGRANSLANLVGSGAMALGPVAAGYLLEATDASRAVLVLGGVMALTALVACVAPGLRTPPEDGADAV
ncbi:MFS transporter [Streptomyces sp. NPDC060243]|uniref:MFS transporter n=1 Tax=Streptomyces sp. NPDC060243 TaxID=3347081 RepID=UPI003653534E